MRSKILLATSVLAGLAAATTGANAQATGFNLYGGGSTLATNLYNRTAQAISTLQNVGVNSLNFGLNTPGAGTTAQGEIFYNGDGSGSGQKAMITQDATVHGFTAGLPVSFGASDAYLTADQLACWNTGSCSSYTGLASTPFTKGGNLIQIPAFGTAIVIAHTNQYAKGISLDDDAICGIFSGAITDWSAATAKPGTNVSAKAAGAINVVYREDGSGTSFLFTQHLAKVCIAGTNAAAGVNFFPTKYFSDVFGSTSNGGTNKIIVSTSPAASFLFGSGSAGVADQLISGINLVGYLTPDFTKIASTALSHYVKVATLLNGGSAPSIAQVAAADPTQSPYQFINYAKVWNTTAGKYYSPNAGGAAKGLANPNTAGGDVSPGYPTTKVNAANPLFWIPQVANPVDGYPIVGYTTLEFATCYSNTSVGNYAKAFITQLYAAANKVNMTAEGFTVVPSGYNKTIISVFVKGTSTYALNINNPTVCNHSTFAGSHFGL
jgi:phosphate transport system substrate-binding protein